ncbi:MAG: glycosyltransferase [Candidatus Obscuribacterales bacterium]|nr:glycosyltransferase [Candidatus Obscuribacterales bacterium]
MDKVTVAIPTYNRDDYLRQVIASVLSESEIDFELLIVDTASPVNVKEIVDSFNDSRVNYFYYPKNLGMVGAGNKCIELCQSEYLMLLADDDRLLPGGLKKLYDQIVVDPQVGAAIGSVLLIDENGQRIGEKVKITEVDRCIDGRDFYRKYLTGRIAVQPCSVLLRTSILNKAGQYDPAIQYCPDMDLWLRVALNGRISLVADSVGEYRIHGGTATTKFKANAEIGRSYQGLIKKQYHLAKSSGLFPDDDLKEMFCVAAGQYAGSCTAIGLDCFKRGQCEVARQYFAIAAELTPTLGGKFYLSMLSLATYGGKEIYTGLQKLRTMVKR